MTTAGLTYTDLRVRQAVMRQLDWDPEVDAGEIGVSVKDGIVNLTGHIGGYSGKLAAERAATRIRGVRAVVNDIEVRPPVERTDSEIAADAARALELRPTIPDSVRVVVHDGHVTLTGRAASLFQKHDAQDAVRCLRGVRGVFNHITVVSKAVERDVRRRIVGALHRRADLDARQVDVAVSGGTVTLKGIVSTCLEREVAEHAAAGAPGIAFVENQIRVEPLETPDSDLDGDEIC
jgi:osmotically-inducible protein OsmY